MSEYSESEMKEMLKTWRPPNKPIESESSFAAPAGSVWASESMAMQRIWWVNVYPDGRISSALCPTREAAMNRSTYTGDTPDAAQVEVTLHIVKRPNDPSSATRRPGANENQ